MKVLEKIKNSKEICWPSKRLKAASYYNVQKGIIRLDDSLPTLIIPDLHGRREFLFQLMSKKVRGKTFYTHLIERNLQVVFTGDAVHAEARGKSRWRNIGKNCGTVLNSSLKNELVESVNTVAMLDHLKCIAPNSLFHLRGNHDDLMEEAVGPYGKYTSESTFFRVGLQKFYPKEFDRLHKYESSLPLMAYNDELICSHCISNMKLNIYGLDLVVNKSKEAFRELAWSDNTYGVCQASIDFLKRQPQAQWVIGHRPVFSGAWEPSISKARVQLDGRIVQINAPEACMFSLKFPGKKLKVYCLSRKNMGVDNDV